MKITYEVTAQRDRDWWVISVPAIKGAHSQARRLEQVDATAREVIALMLDQPEDTFDVAIEVEAPKHIQAAIDRARKIRIIADSAQAEATAAATAAALAAVESGLTIRDAGVLMGVSYQRVHQLVNGKTTRVERPRAKVAPTKSRRLGHA